MARSDHLELWCDSPHRQPGPLKVLPVVDTFVKQRASKTRFISTSNLQIKGIGLKEHLFRKRRASQLILSG